MTLARRLALTMAVLVLATAAGIALLTYRSLEELVAPAELYRLEARAQRIATELDGFVRDARADLLAEHGSAPLLALARGEASDGDWRERLATDLVAELSANPEYLQFRLIGVADGGRELIRVQRSEAGAKVRVMPRLALQRKGERDYFKQALALDAGEVYISPVELNREHGAVELPPVPVVRVAAPVHGSGGRPLGVLVLNVDLRRLFERTRESAGSEGRVYVVNARGDYLVHPDPAREFGFELGTPHTLHEDFPNTAGTLMGTPGHAGRVEDARGLRHGAASVSVALGGGPTVTVIETLPYEQVVAPAASSRRTSLLAGLAAAIIAILIAVRQANTLSRPLVQMARQVAAFRGDRHMALPVRHGGELDALARAFNRMAEEVRDRTSALRREVDERQRAERELARVADTERLFAAVVESTDEAVIACTLDGTITAWNRAAEGYFGHPASEAVGRSIDLISPPERRGEVRRLVEAVGRGVDVQHYEFVRENQAGRPVDLSLSLSPIRAASGEIGAAAIIARDDSERVAAEEKLRLAIEAAPSGMIMVDHDGVVVLVNSEVERQFGYARDELIGQPIDLLVGEALRAAHREHRRRYMGAPRQRPMGDGQSLTGLRRDGSEFPVEIALNPIETREGLMVMGVVIDITERRQAEETIRASLEEKELLLKEVYHRVKNNLQVLASLMGMQENALPEGEARQVLRESGSRVRAMVLVHELLYQSERLASVDFARYVEHLVAHLTDAFSARTRGVEIRRAIEAVELDVDKAIPLGLIINELVSNSLRHAYPDGRQGTVSISLARGAGGDPVLRVTDDGVGLPAGFDLDGCDSLGLNLVKALATQLGGAIELHGGERGTVALLTL